MAEVEMWKAAARPSLRSSPAQPQPTSSLLQPQLQPPMEDSPQSNGQTQKKRKAKACRLREQNNMQADGAVSDSVLPPMASPSKQPVDKQRQQSVALPIQSAHAIKSNMQKQRPVSMGGNMLPATPLKEQAYAGPTFQASPAASALPMPKFFSKSVPNVAKHSASLDARMAGQKTPEQESSPEPDVVSPQPPPRSTQQSPLDVFFNAQKAENQRKVSMQSSEMKARQAPPPATEPRNPFQKTEKSIFLRELDGDSEAMPSPKTVPTNKIDRDVYTQQLKDLLFNGTNGLASPNVAVTPPPTHHRSSSNLQSPDQEQLYPPSPPMTQRSTSGPSTPTPTAEQNNHYSLHYGNRNLSPLFKAAANNNARGDMLSRPSNLRQHSSASDSSPGQSQQQQPPIDPNSFSRNYLDQHIRASPPATLPNNLPGMNGVPRQQSYQSAPQYPSSTRHVNQQGVPVTGNGASPRTASNGAPGRDIPSMEDDLRRMLKVNVLGN